VSTANKLQWSQRHIFSAQDISGTGQSNLHQHQHSINWQQAEKLLSRLELDDREYNIDTENNWSSPMMMMMMINSSKLVNLRLLLAQLVELPTLNREVLGLRASPLVWEQSWIALEQLIVIVFAEVNTCGRSRTRFIAQGFWTPCCVFWLFQIFEKDRCRKTCSCYFSWISVGRWLQLTPQRRKKSKSTHNTWQRKSDLKLLPIFHVVKTC